MQDQKASLLAHFESILFHLVQQAKNYRQTINEATGSTKSKPKRSVFWALLAETEIKINMIPHLYNFEGMFHNFLDTLDEEERGAVNEVRFILDDIFENQAKINAIYDARHERLERLADPKNKRGVRDVDLSPLTVNDMMIMTESMELFDAVLRKILPSEFEHLMVAYMNGVKDLDVPDVKILQRAMDPKIKKLNALGIQV